MSKPVYYYFHARAMGDAQRMLMAYGDYEFEDRRIRLANWPAFKPKTVYGQLPILEVDGKQYAQCLALARYFGRKFGLAGDTEEEDLEIDMIVDFYTDIRLKASSVAYEEDEVIKKQKHEKLSKEVYPDLLKKFASIVEKNNGHLALGKLTWADFVFAGSYDYFKYILQMPDLDRQYPVFKKIEQTVYSIPKVKKFVDASPQDYDLPY